MALGVVGCQGQFFGKALDQMMFLGELSLDGSVRPVRGALSAAIAARDNAEQVLSEAAQYAVDMRDVHGHQAAKRALEVACAGGHNILIIGPPGAGKTMLAKRIPTILPPMSLEEAIETTRIHSVAGTLENCQGLVGTRPFRSPHHTIRDAGLIGGGAVARPGRV
jgi:magnesium chelatase family protein